MAPHSTKQLLVSSRRKPRPASLPSFNAKDNGSGSQQPRAAGKLPSRRAPARPGGRQRGSAGCPPAPTAASSQGRAVRRGRGGSERRCLKMGREKGPFGAAGTQRGPRGRRLRPMPGPGLTAAAACSLSFAKLGGGRGGGRRARESLCCLGYSMGTALPDHPAVPLRRAEPPHHCQRRSSAEMPARPSGHARSTQPRSTQRDAQQARLSLRTRGIRGPPPALTPPQASPRLARELRCPARTPRGRAEAASASGPHPFPAGDPPQPFSATQAG